MLFMVARHVRRMNFRTAELLQKEIETCRALDIV